MLNKQKIGIIGGMGPFASSRLLEILLNRSCFLGAKNSGDFPEIILDSIPIEDFISDTKSISISKKILSSKVNNLTKQNCQKIAIACNTAHIMFPELNKISGGIMVSIIDAVKDKVLASNATRVGLIATPTTIKTGLYQKALSNTKVNLTLPDRSLIRLAEKAIRAEISGKTNKQLSTDLFNETISFMVKNKLDLVILGCTELPLVFKDYKSDKFIDCLEALSEILIN